MPEGHSRKSASVAVPAYGAHLRLGSISSELKKLRKGESATANGVILAYEPKLSARAPPMVSGLPDRYGKPMSMLLQQIDQTELDPKQRIGLMKKISKVYADYYGAKLPEHDRLQLIELYAKNATESSRIVRSFDRKRASVDEIRGKFLDLMVDSAFTEMSIFAGNREAQAMRFSKWRGTNAPDSKLKREALAKAFNRLLSGEYLQRDSEISKAEARKYMALVPSERTISVRPSGKSAAEKVVKGVTMPRPLTYTLTKSYSVPGTEEWWAQVYTSEHSIVGDVLGDYVPEDWGLMHVSILGGIWKRHVENVIEETYVQLPSSYAHSVGTVPHRSLVGEKKYHRERVVFDGWYIANGSASWIRSDDILFLKGIYKFDSHDGAFQFLKSSTPTARGNYNAVRACAYSVGMWATNWLCHQNSNAFSVRKWNLTPVQYWTNMLFGPYGNFPIVTSISKQFCDLCRTSGIKGGVPGNGLHYHDCLYVVPGYELFDMLMDGGGFGLEAYWNPSSGWNNTGAAFKTRMAPVRGEDWVGSPEDGWV